jgi:glycogen synthase
MVTARFLPRVGGTEVHTYEVAKRLAALGIELTVLATERESNPVPSELYEGFHVIRVKAWPRRRDWYIAPAIRQVVTSRRWDLVHIQGIHTMVLPVAIVAARRARLPYVITLHSGGHSSALRRFLRVLAWNALGNWIRASERLIAGSNFERHTFSRLLAVPPEEFSVIPSGVDLSDASRPPRENCRFEIRSEPLILSVGRLERYKGHDRIVRALPGVAAHHPDVKLIIVGSGPQERHLRRLATGLGITERVEILNIPADRRAQLGDLLDRARLVVALSEYESQGLAALEAAARGCSVLVADGSALSELVASGHARGVPLGTTQDLTAAVIRQLEHPHHPVGGALPTWDECAARVYQLYCSLLRPTDHRVRNG